MTAKNIWEELTSYITNYIRHFDTDYIIIVSPEKKLMCKKNYCRAAKFSFSITLFL